jgi:hypothetical protein
MHFLRELQRIALSVPEVRCETDMDCSLSGRHQSRGKTCRSARTSGQELPLLSDSFAAESGVS